MTELLYLRDAYLGAFDAMVVDVRVHDDETVGVALDRTAFYPTGGGQPHDTGVLDGRAVINVGKDGETAWHTVTDGAGLVVGSTVHGEIDWIRRHRLMRTHSALHVLGGVVWNRWGALATGNNMEPLSARIDYEFDPLPEGFARDLEQAINQEIALDRRIEISFLPTAAAAVDPDLIRTKANLIPGWVTDVRVVDIVGLDKQTDGGTHVRSTGEIGVVRVVKTESKGKGNKRIRIEIVDA